MTYFDITPKAHQQNQISTNRTTSKKENRKIDNQQNEKVTYAMG